MFKHVHPYLTNIKNFVSKEMDKTPWDRNDPNNEGTMQRWGTILNNDQFCSTALLFLKEKRWCLDCWARSAITQDTRSKGLMGGLAGGPQHLKPIRVLWNIPQGSSTLARGHCKGPHTVESAHATGMLTNSQQGEKSWIWYGRLWHQRIMQIKNNVPWILYFLHMFCTCVHNLFVKENYN